MDLECENHYDDNGKMKPKKKEHVKGVTPCLYCILPFIACFFAIWFFKPDATEAELKKYYAKGLDMTA